jgi:hypothetical protein
MQHGSTIAITVAAVTAISYLLFKQWRHEQQLSGEAKQQWWHQQMLPILFLTTLINIGLATLARVNGILLLVGGTLAAGMLFGFPALKLYHHSQHNNVPQGHLIAIYSICFLVFAFAVGLIFAWLRLFELL